MTTKTPLSDAERKTIHDLALNARALLTADVRELLEGTYGLYADGRLESPDRLPQVVADPDTAETYRRLSQFLEDEARAGLPKPEAIEKLVKEAAFTHLNRLVAFKMMEARKLIRGTLDKGVNSNAFKFYLADHLGDMESFQRGDVDSSYRRFLLWQAGQVAQEMAVLFDPETLPSRLFPRPRALNVLIDWLNQPEMAGCWQADETIGWVYQFFNEHEKAEVFAGLKAKHKIRRQDIPAATQLFTPNWIVRFLVQNTLGRTWVQMHPDTRLLNTELLDYLVPLQGDVSAEPLRLVREITLLDPACGTMHFGLVAFDLFAAMYLEELERAGEPGWLETPSINDPAAIASTIVGYNLYGIDIDLRAVQLSALALYLKAKALNKNAVITDSHLACADVLPLNGSRLGTFLREMQFSPLIERLIKTLWERLKDVNQFGSLLRLEREINALIAGEKPLTARIEAGLTGETSITDEAFWELIIAQIMQGLDEFARQQAQSGADMRFFTGEAVKGLRLLDVLLRRYDVVVANPPYSGKRNLNDTLAAFLDDQYPDTKGDLYAAFIERCAEMLEAGGRLGMITQQSFMFLSSYEAMRQNLCSTTAIEAMAHTGPLVFPELNSKLANTTAFTLQSTTNLERLERSIGTYIRIIKAPGGDGKREGLEYSLVTGTNLYHVAQSRFNAIPGAPWAYWVSETIRELFVTLPKLGDVAQPRQGLATADNFRFLRFWWETGIDHIGFGCKSLDEAQKTGKRWFPYMKGGEFRRWYGNQEWVIIFDDLNYRILSESGNKLPSRQFYFREGLTFSSLSSIGLSVRLLPDGFVFDQKGWGVFTTRNIFSLASYMNSRLLNYFVGINPTVSFGGAELSGSPLFSESISNVSTAGFAKRSIRLGMWRSFCRETTFEFLSAFRYYTGLSDATAAQARLTDLERQIDDEVYKLYGIEGEDRAAIEAELAGGSFAAEEEVTAEAATDDSTAEEIAESLLTHEELAVRWISYALGVVLGRFQPGVVGALGRAIYKRTDFAVGSLPAPDADEFDLLVGTPDRFAYIDSDGGRHVFSAEVESDLQALAVPDGITVLDEGHPRDLPSLVEQALALMLGDSALDEVIRVGAGGDLRKFLSKDFFTSWHFRWYRKRPVYWVLQSAKRSYGFVLFHERLSEYSLYTLLRDYLDYRINRLRNQIADLESRRADLSGKSLKTLEKDIDGITREVDELNEFSKTMERIANDGYQPQPNWIDDGVILRLAPLWELIPIWKTEPKKHWEKLEAGDFDWSHLAMHYWPDRVREKCRTNKSFAIAHGHEEWFEAHS